MPSVSCLLKACRRVLAVDIMWSVMMIDAAIVGEWCAESEAGVCRDEYRCQCSNERRAEDNQSNLEAVH